jgi:hypothetical protein
MTLQDLNQCREIIIPIREVLHTPVYINVYTPVYSEIFLNL